MFNQTDHSSVAEAKVRLLALDPEFRTLAMKKFLKDELDKCIQFILKNKWEALQAFIEIERESEFGPQVIESVGLDFVSDVAALMIKTQSELEVILAAHPEVEARAQAAMTAEITRGRRAFKQILGEGADLTEFDKLTARLFGEDLAAAIAAADEAEASATAAAEAAAAEIKEAEEIEAADDLSI